ncbi:hypothetical protein [uncultured Duncaniella sp.]|jgi:hypothetical protein|nr:hypothetical protein [uncultured Duncaniella sp.]
MATAPMSIKGCGGHLYIVLFFGACKKIAVILKIILGKFGL